VAETVDALSDLVKDWMTLNEPFASSVEGYHVGCHAPGRREEPDVVAQVIHNLLLAHGLGVQAIRSNCSPGSEVGIAMNTFVHCPVSEKPEDVAAARRQQELENGWWFDPLFKGTYPDGKWMNLEGACPVVRPGDMEIIAGKTDFVGLNVYTATFTANDQSSPTGTREASPRVSEVTDMGWSVVPEALYEAVHWVGDDYQPPKIYITENGAAYRDIVSVDGRVHDAQRIEYLRRHINQLHRAVDDGYPVRGYFVWSLMDNFEWCHGYSKRFGIVYIDYANGNRRIPKDSYYCYQDYIRGARQQYSSDRQVPASALAGPVYAGFGSRGSK
jgi:beta-glucosidase